MWTRVCVSVKRHFVCQLISFYELHSPTKNVIIKIFASYCFFHTILLVLDLLLSQRNANVLFVLPGMFCAVHRVVRLKYRKVKSLLKTNLISLPLKIVVTSPFGLPKVKCFVFKMTYYKSLFHSRSTSQRIIILI